jgi:inosine/xanthosine triphosphate pyrophosphatase family protein
MLVASDDVDGRSDTPWRLFLATSNSGKQRETDLLLRGVPHVVHEPFTPASPFVEIGDTFQDIARSKLSQLSAEFQLTHRKACLVTEHSGLLIPALAGTFGLDPFPGIRTNGWLTKALQRELGVDSVESRGQAQNVAILRLMHDRPDRQARYVDAAAACVIDSFGNMLFRTFVADVNLVVLECEQGNEGWEYDRIVALPGSQSSLAALPAQVKAASGARAKIYNELVSWLMEMEVG